MELQVIDQQLLQGALGQIGHNGPVFVRHLFPHPGDLPGPIHDLVLGHHLADHAVIQHVLGGELAGGHHVVVAPLGAEVVLAHQTHAVAGNQTALGVGNLHLAVVAANGHIGEEGGIPVEAGTGHRADGGNVQIKYHILDKVGVIKILVLEALGGQLGVSLPAVGVRLDHPGVADVGENNDLIFEVQGENTDQLADCPVGHAAVVHGAVLGFPGHLENAVLPVQVGEILKPLFVLVQLGQLHIIGHRGSHNHYLQKFLCRGCALPSLVGCSGDSIKQGFLFVKY